MKRESAYIIGSGPSLLDLTEQEKCFLNEHRNTLSLNQYLLHWDTVGVIPKQPLMADGQFPCIKIFVETQKVIQELKTSIDYYVPQNYLNYFPAGLNWREWKHAIRKRLQVWRKFGYRMPLRINRDNLSVFSQASEARYQHLISEDGWYWAKTLNDPLYFWRGTLTSAINLASILWPDADIKLLGVDLNSYGYFFDPKRGEEDREDFHKFNEKRLSETSAVHHRKSHAQNTHATAVTYEQDGKTPLPGIQSAFPRMMEELAKTGNTLNCSNPNSLLVTDGVCPYSPIIPE